MLVKLKIKLAVWNHQWLHENCSTCLLIQIYLNAIDAVIILFQNVINLRKDICFTGQYYAILRLYSHTKDIDFNVFVKNLGYDD